MLVAVFVVIIITINYYYYWIRRVRKKKEITINSRFLPWATKHKVLFFHRHKRNSRIEWKDGKFRFLLRLYFRAVLSSHQNWGDTQISHTPLPPGMHSLPCYQHFPPEWYICCNQRTYIETSLTPKVHRLQVQFLISWMRNVCGTAKYRSLAAVGCQSL